MSILRGNWRNRYSDHPEDFNYWGDPLPDHVIEKRRRKSREEELVSLIEPRVVSLVETHVDRISSAELPAAVEAILNDLLARRNGQCRARR